MLWMMTDTTLFTTELESGPSLLYCWAVRECCPVGLPYSSQKITPAVFLLPPPSDEEDGGCQRARKQRLPSVLLLVLLMELLGQATLAQHQLKKLRDH